MLSADELREGVSRMAGHINRRYERRPLTIVGVLTGSIVLVADLIRQLEMPLRIVLVQARSYRGRSTAPGSLYVDAGALVDLRGQDVLIVDDIYDTGRTLEELISLIDATNPASVRVAVLLRKLGRQQIVMEPDWIGFDIPDEFVVGYGLDYDDLYRNLPYLAALEPADLHNPAADGESPA
ncbi:MAG: hypoxanthine phosphoribosyltransferase [Pirellulales bacterium]